MGACEFSITAIGKTPGEAYRAAREEAEYDSGHDPYSGTITSTTGFQMIVKPKGKRLKVFLRELEEDVINTHNWVALVWDSKQEAYVPNPKPKPERKHPGVFNPMIDGSKWGDCGCIEVGKAFREEWDDVTEAFVKKTIRGCRTYQFWGWAAC